jgi:hypothetical protein
MSASRLFSLPKVLNTTEDAHKKTMSTFETDEHLQALTPSQHFTL